MSRSRGTGLLHSRSLSLFYILILFFCLYSRTVLAVPIYKEYIHRRNINENPDPNSNITILCTKSQTTSNAALVTTNVKTIIQTDVATETEVITKTIIGGGEGSTNSRVVVETTSILTTVQSSGTVVSDVGTEPGAVFSTPDYTSSSSESTSTVYISYSTLSRPAITMIASPPLALVPTNQPEERPAPSSEISTTTTTFIESTTSTTSESSTSGVPTPSIEITTTSIEITTTPIEITIVSTYTPIISTSASSTSTPDASSMASNVIIPINTLQPSLDSETTSLLPQSSSLTTSVMTSQTTISTSPTPSTSSPTPQKTGYILTGILLPQPSDLPAAQSTRIQLDGGVAMPSSTGGAETDLNGPPELVFRGDAGKSINVRSIGVWCLTGVVAVILGVVV